MKILSIRNINMAIVIVALQLVSNALMADEIEIADGPLVSVASSTIKPNILFILDDSESMGWDYIPDSVNDDRDKLCFGYYGYNKIFYNPNYRYPVPINADGAPLAAPSFTSAWTDGYAQTGSVDLSDLNKLSTNSTSCGKKCTTKYYYSVFSDNGALICNDAKFDIVTTLTASEKQNYANWYSFYRTRQLAMRAGIGLSLINLNDKYRIGFTTANEGRLDNSFNEQPDLIFDNLSVARRIYSLHVREFGNAQKQSFFKRLYAAPANSSAPLRGALMKGGQYFAKKLGSQKDSAGQPYDPLEYSCQQNFVVLSTGSFWSADNETSSYGPYQLNGSRVGNQDAGTSVARPYQDDYRDARKCYGNTGGSGVSDSLADVAMYYYKTDLRTSTLGNCIGALGGDVCKNNVSGSDDDTAAHQHITLFTLGMGADGLLQYTEDYKQGGSADYNAILNGKKPWPDPIGCSEESRIDDLWHAAVNGRGSYLSVKTPQSLIDGLSSTLSVISARNGSSAAATTSSLGPVVGDSFVYVALYRTVNWDGDLKAFEINQQTAEISSTALWSAQEQLDIQIGNAAKKGDGRDIYMFSNSTSSKLRPFTYASLIAEGKSGFFDLMCGITPKLSQCADLSLALTEIQKNLLSGENLVNYLRGQSNYEIQANNTVRLYRDREHTLGDPINAVPAYLKKPPFSYADFGYSDFVAAHNDRDPTVFLAANDGMLHAFDAETGRERWAFVPTAVLSELYKLADVNYAQNHQFFVDGSPVIADICIAGCTKNGATWKTILVGGLNKGGRSYYALDVTDPTSPRGLWEFSDDDLGLSFGNPVVTKNKEGTWVVLFSSGYNNISPGDGNGYLFVVDASTGNLIDKIPTLENGSSIGTVVDPSGLAKINIWVENETDNTAKRAYGGDLLGNIWRFDFDDNYLPDGKESVKLAQLRVAGDVYFQPITTKPELAKINDLYDVVFIGTGRYLGEPDLSDDGQQSIYALKDMLDDTGLGDVRQGHKLVEQTLTEETNDLGEIVRTISSQHTVDWGSKDGWYFDLNPKNLSPGERVGVDMQQQYNTLTIATNVPDPNACNIGGYGFLYNIDISTGGGVSTAAMDGTQVGTRLSGDALVTGIKIIKLTSDKTAAIVTDAIGTIMAEDISTNPAESAGDSAKRTMWREIFD